MSGKYHLDDAVSPEPSGASDRGLRDAIRDLPGRTRDAIHDAAESIDKQTGLLTSIRERPLAAAGIAFATGFLLAGTDDPPRHVAVARARARIRSALIAGVSAALSRQLRTFVDQHGGLGSLLTSLRSTTVDSDDEDADEGGLEDSADAVDPPPQAVDDDPAEG